jgi:uncharacterized membrane protein
MSADHSRRNRYPEVDAFRGVAISMMILFHLVFDLSFFSIYPVEVQSGSWKVFGYTTAVLFVLVAGIAVALKSEKLPYGAGSRDWYLSFLTRGLFLIGIGYAITVVTYIVLNGEGFVIFGILHLIGASTIIAAFFVRLPHSSLLMGIIIILIGFSLPLPQGPIWFSFIGIHPADFYSVDYTPLIPWFGVFLIGVEIGSWLYPGGIRRFSMSDRALQKMVLPACIGRHSLIIYLLHQPVLIALLYLISGKTFVL